MNKWCRTVHFDISGRATKCMALFCKASRDCRPTTTTSVYQPFSRTTWVGWRQKGRPFWILLEQEMTGWQWHQLDNMQIICTLLQTDNHASTGLTSHHSESAELAAKFLSRCTAGSVLKLKSWFSGENWTETEVLTGVQVNSEAASG